MNCTGCDVVWCEQADEGKSDIHLVYRQPDGTTVIYNAYYTTYIPRS